MKQKISRVYIEITSRCNLNCAFCSSAGRTGQDMDPAFFASLLPQVKQLTDFIYLHVQGEPLLHPSLEEIMDICDKERMQVQLVTNGTLLNMHPHLIDHPSLRKISFSLQSVEYHTRDELALLQEILAFCHEASKRDLPYCEIRFWRDEQLAMPRTERCLHYLQDNYSFAENSRADNYRIMDHVYVDFHNPFEWPAMDRPVISTTGRCLGGLHQLAVLSDGTVVPCCLDAYGNIPLGSLHEESLEDILNGSRYVRLCEGFLSNHLSEELCRRCPYRLRFDQKI